MSTETISKSAEIVIDESVDAKPPETKVDVEVNRSAEEYALKLKEVSAENKKFRTRFSSLESTIEELKSQLTTKEHQELEQKGKWEEAYKKLATEHDGFKKTVQKKEAEWTFKEVSNQLEREAAKQGCVDTRALIKLASADGILDDLVVNDDLTVSQDSLKASLERASKQYSYLFSKSAPKFKDGVPGVTDISAKKIDFNKMSMKELMEFANKHKDQLA